MNKNQPISTNADQALDSKLEAEAHRFLRDTVGIPVDKRKPWNCLSCLLSQVYDLFCRAGPEGDALFFKEVEQTKFERVTEAQKDPVGHCEPYK